MSFGHFHAISFLSLASISFALQIQIPDKKHVFQGQNTTVSLIHDETDPTDVLLKEIRLRHNNTSNGAIHVAGFTADAQVNITFDHTDEYQIFAYGNTSDPIAHSSVFEVHDDLEDHLHHGSKKGLIVGVVLGSVALIVIVLLTVYLIFFRSRRRRSFQDQALHHSPTVPTPFLSFWKHSPTGKSSNFGGGMHVPQKHSITVAISCDEQWISWRDTTVASPDTTAHSRQRISKAPGQRAGSTSGIRRRNGKCVES